MSLPGYIPGLIDSYDPSAKLARVSIPGFTDNAEKLPLAEFNYPIGDNGLDTDIKCNNGDGVWLVFRNGDPRFPIIVGFRPINVGNETEWRRWAHDNIQLQTVDLLKLLAGSDFTLSAGGNGIIEAAETITVKAGTTLILQIGDGSAVKLVLSSAGIQIVAPEIDATEVLTSTFGGPVTAEGLLSGVGLAVTAPIGGGASATIAGDITQTSGDFTTAGAIKGTGGVDLVTHEHNDPQGGKVGPPVAP